MTVSVKFSGMDSVLAKLSGEKRVSLARSMAVAGGSVIRDEAQLLAPLGPTGNLKSAIYLAFKDGQSNESQVVYSVSWNHLKAPHGHLIEFGHWRVNEVEHLPDGTWRFTAKRLPEPVWVSARPFLRPAYDATKGRATDAMLARGKQRLTELLGEDSGA